MAAILENGGQFSVFWKYFTNRWRYQKTLQTKVKEHTNIHLFCSYNFCRISNRYRENCDLSLKNLIFYFLPYTVCVWRKYCDGKKIYFDMFVEISVLRSAECKKVGYKKCRSIFYIIYMCVCVCVCVCMCACAHR